MKRLSALSLTLLLGITTLTAPMASIANSPKASGHAAIQPSALPHALERPIVKDGTVLTAWGTPLRGLIGPGVQDLDNDPEGVTIASMAKVREQGLNCVCVSLPWDDPENPTWENPRWMNDETSKEYKINIPFYDEAIDRAEELGLYVCVSIGLGGQVFDPEAVYDFWRLFANRYKDRKHVFFDLMNEMDSYVLQGVTFCDPIGVEARAYEIIREAAPDTLCLLWSFVLTNSENMIQIVKDTDARVAGGISWENAAVGFHSYDSVNTYRDEDNWLALENFRNAIRRFKDAGYPVINTEVPALQMAYGGWMDITNNVNADLLRVLEEEGVSWFTPLDIYYCDEPNNWRGVVERAGLAWEPDYGDWPAPGLISPYKPNSAVSGAAETNGAVISQGNHAAAAEDRWDGGEDVLIDMTPCYFVGDGGYVRYPSVNFGVLEPISLTVRARGVVDGARVVAREGGPDGPVVCELPIKHTVGESPYYTSYLQRPISGVKDVTFTFEAPEGDEDTVGNFIEWQFNLPPVVSGTVHTDIGAGPVPAAHYNYGKGGLARRPGGDSGASTEAGRELSVCGITDGSAVSFDYVPFLRFDGEFKIRAKTLAGGRIDVYANHGFAVTDVWNWSLKLGSVEIYGNDGEWAEYSCDLAAPEPPYNSLPCGYDLLLVFTAFEDGAPGDELFDLSEFTYPPTGGSHEGAAVRGRVASYAPGLGTTLRLMQGDEVKYEAAIPAKDGTGRVEQDFEFEGVADGTYSLVVTKPAHTKITVGNIEVAGTDVDLANDEREEARLITLPCGDLNGDSLVNNGDLAVLWRIENYNRGNTTL